MKKHFKQFLIISSGLLLFTLVNSRYCQAEEDILRNKRGFPTPHQIDSLNKISKIDIKIVKVKSLSNSEVIDSNTIQSVSRGIRYKKIKQCYLDQIKQDPNLAGDITLRVNIKPTGKVASIRLEDSKWTDAVIGKSVEECICDQISEWQFMLPDNLTEPIDAMIQMNFFVPYVRKTDTTHYDREHLVR